MNTTLLKYNSNILKRDSVNKSNRTQKQRNHPRIESVVLNFKLPKTGDLKTCARFSLALELITGAKRPTIHISGKGRQSFLSGVSLKLKGKKMRQFLTYFILEIQPKLKETALPKQNSTAKQLSFTVNSTEVFVFSELEFNRHIFPALPRLGISFIFDRKIPYNEQRTLCQLPDFASLYNSIW